MYYVIIGRDVAGSLPQRLAARPAHLDRLKALQAEGRLFVAGPMPLLDAPDLSGGVAGSVVIAEFSDLEAAKAWAGADPYVAAGVYASVDVHPYIKSLPA